jgi:hypothetical protein
MTARQVGVAVRQRGQPTRHGAFGAAAQLQHVRMKLRQGLAK